MRNAFRKSLLGSVWFLVAGLAGAAPNMMHFQGRLTDNLGAPIAGSSEVQFKIYSVQTGGAEIWSSGQKTVNANESGLFVAEIGPFNDAAFFTQYPAYYLEILVASLGGGAFNPLAPRQKLQTVPFSFSSGRADTAGTADLANSLAPNTVGSGQIQTGVVQSSHIEDETIEASDLSSSVILSTHISPNAIQAQHIENGSVQKEDLAPGAIQASDLPPQSIAGWQLMNNAIATLQIATEAVQTSDLGDGAVTRDKIQGDAINSIKIEDESIQSADIGPEAVTPSEIQAEAIQTGHLTDASVTKEKIDMNSFSGPGVGFVPPGAIFMFLGSCPDDYQEVTALRNRVPVGADIDGVQAQIPNGPGAMAGDYDHRHPVQYTHVFQGEIEAFSSLGWVPFAEPVMATAVNGSPVSGVGVRGKPFSFTFGSDQSNQVEGSNHIPPSLTVLFCEKQ